MMSSTWTRKGVALAAAFVVFACVAVLVTLNATSPEPVASAALCPEWQCSRLAFMFTTCSRIGEVEAATIRVRKKEPCPPPGT